MSVLVTGGAGYIGSHMVHELHDRGEEVVVLDNLSTGQSWALPPEVSLFVGETTDIALVSSILGAFGVDTIVHFAAAIVVPDSVADPLRYYANNTMSSRTLLEAAVQGGVRNFIFSSTAAVYGDPVNVPVAEDAPTLPTSPYGSSKLMTEIMLRDVSSVTNVRHVILRYFNVAGADPRRRTGQSGQKATHLIKIAVQAALGIRPGVDIFGQDYPTPDGTCIRDYIHVTDLVRAHLAALDHLRAGGSNLTLNCGYGHGYSVREVVETVKRVCDVDFQVTRSARRPGDPARIVAGIEGIRKTLPWRPAFDDLDTIVAHAFEWEKELMSRGKVVDRRNPMAGTVSANRLNQPGSIAGWSPSPLVANGHLHHHPFVAGK